MYSYVGKSWNEQYNCFSHFMDVQKNQFGVDDFDQMNDMPNVMDYGEALSFVENKENNSLNKLWEEVDKPQEGDAIIFGMGRVKFHIGTYVNVDFGGILHCTKAGGVAFTPMRALKQYNTSSNLILRHRRQ